MGDSVLQNLVHPSTTDIFIVTPLFAQPTFINEIPIPPLIDAAEGTIELEMRVTNHKFNPGDPSDSLNGGVNQPDGIRTYCYNVVGDSTMTILGPTLEWHTLEGISITVKSSAYLQSWHQNRLSTIRFGIPETQAWDAETNNYSEKRKRQADVYVFSLLHHKEKSTVDPLNLAQWSFYVISTEKLNRELGEQKSVGLKRLLQVGVETTRYAGLAETIARAFATDS